MIIIDYTFINASHPELYLVDADGSHVTSIRVVLPGYSKWEDVLGTIKIKVYSGGTATDFEYDLVNNNSDVSFGKYIICSMKTVKLMFHLLLFQEVHITCDIILID